MIYYVVEVAAKIKKIVQYGHDFRSYDVAWRVAFGFYARTLAAGR